jgi:hypothetical protein
MSLGLTRFERRWAHACFDTIFPGPDRGPLPLGICDMELDHFLDDTFREVPFEAALGLRLAVWFLALAPLFVIGRLATIASLSPVDRERVLLAIGASSVYAVRATVVALKAIGALFYCGDGRVRHYMMGRAALPGASGVVPLRVRGQASPSAPSNPGASHEPERRTA